MELIADTTFLIGLWRRQSWALNFAARNSNRSMGVPWVVLGEFWHGAINAKHDGEKVRQFLKIGVHITDAGQVVEAYAQICAKLQKSGSYRDIGQNDLWIAAVAQSYRVPLVTRNRRHFDQIEGLNLEILED